MADGILKVMRDELVEMTKEELIKFFRDYDMTLRYRWSADIRTTRMSIVLSSPQNDRYFPCVLITSGTKEEVRIGATQTIGEFNEGGAAQGRIYGGHVSLPLELTICVLGGTGKLDDLSSLVWLYLVAGDALKAHGLYIEPNSARSGAMSTIPYRGTQDIYRRQVTARVLGEWTLKKTYDGEIAGEIELGTGLNRAVL